MSSEGAGVGGGVGVDVGVNVNDGGDEGVAAAVAVAESVDASAGAGAGASVGADGATGELLRIPLVLETIHPEINNPTLPPGVEETGEPVTTTSTSTPQRGTETGAGTGTTSAHLPPPPPMSSSGEDAILLASRPTEAAPIHPILPGLRTAPKAIIRPKQSTDASELERRKNEIVSEMLARLKPFVTPQGALKVDADFDAYAELMAGETHFVQRTLLLTVLLGAGGTRKEEVFKSMCSSMRLLTVLSEWLQECAKAETPMLGKLLDLISSLPLTVDQLVSLKLGKLIKRLATSTAIHVETKEKAENIVVAWTKLARTEDARRRNSTESLPSKPPKDKDKDKEKIASLRRSSEAGKPLPLSSSASSSEAGPVANMSLFSETPKPASPPLKTRAAQILERVARGETSKVVSRPLSADDIHKEKKRQQYLAEAASRGKSASHPESIEEKKSDATSLANSPATGGGDDDSLDRRERPTFAGPEEVALAPAPAPTPASPLINEGIKRSLDEDQAREDHRREPKRAKKRVSFATEEELVQIHYYDPPEDEDYDRPERRKRFIDGPTKSCVVDHRDIHELDRNEASYAFRQMALAMEAECEWRQPSPLGEASASVRGAASSERKIQEERERTALSAVYFSLEDVPSSPSESLLTREDVGGPPNGDHLTKRIPLRDVDGRVTMVLRTVSSPSPAIKPSPPAAPVQNAIPPADLLNLLSNPIALQDILKNVAPPATLPAPPPARSFPAAAPYPSHAPPPRPPPPPPPMHSLPGRPFPPMPPLPPGFIPPGMPHPPFAFGMPPPPPMGAYPPPFAFRPLPPSQPQPAAQRPTTHHPQKRHSCKFYRAGKPNSCKFGTSCQFLHSDY